MRNMMTIIKLRAMAMKKWGLRMNIMKLIGEIIFFRYIKPPFLNWQGKPGDFPYLAKLI